MAQRQGSSGANRTPAAPGAQRSKAPLPGMSDTASMLRSRRATGVPGPGYSDEMDEFEVETPGDAALHELPSGIIMPGIKSTRVIPGQAQGDGVEKRTPKTLKATSGARPRAAPPKLPSKGASASVAGPLRVAGPSKPLVPQLKGTPARAPRYSLPVRTEKQVRTSKVSGRHVVLPMESQLAPLPSTPADEEEEDDEDEEDEEVADKERLREAHAPAPEFAQMAAPPRSQKRRGPVYYSFERMPPHAREYTILPRLTSYAISASIHVPTLLGFLRREHGIRPRLYEGCAYAMYFKPLLPGFGRATVRSSREPSGAPGDESRHERQIQRHEESGYVGSYFDQADDQQNFDTDGYIQGGRVQERAESAQEPPRDAPHAPAIDESRVDSLLTEMMAEEAQRRASHGETLETSHADLAGARDMLRQEEANEELGIQDANTDAKPRRKVLRINEASHTHETRVNEQAPKSIREALQYGEMVVLTYGVVVLFNFTQAEEESLLADIRASGAVLNSHREYDRELFHYCYDPNVPAPRIYNDFFTFRAPNHLLKISLALAIAQSTKLSEFEESMQRTLELTSHIPRELAQTGELRVSRRGALRMSGHLFKLRVDVNLTSDVLDTPDLFWNEASLQALYDAIREYLEIDQRAETLNERLAVANDLLEIIHEHLNNNAMSKITWIIIALIVAACIVALGEISARLLVAAKYNRGVSVGPSTSSELL
ncbi:Sad1-interacting factor 3 [Malassezia vespertilionis]|uniref:DUF155 domain-containing protein n=1 Tax=Malassezia vespertilionis TaxID=2020962 RepID=A0A2N1J725_9BASI|nr:Sad1-interacting factor 3 [Malassezia vespertilionis]PKI82344.1 hypothetical protein MVES_003728 [Malassezia vespertilionis]WFD08120.1 Sad1-interacting factor 3 [Malassezia vespertilionis]